MFEDSETPEYSSHTTYSSGRSGIETGCDRENLIAWLDHVPGSWGRGWNTPNSISRGRRRRLAGGEAVWRVEGGIVGGEHGGDK